MKLIYFTPKRFKFFSADNSYVLQLAEGFRKILGDDLIFVFLDKEEDALKGFNSVNLDLGSIGKSKKLNFFWPYLYLIFWTPFFLIKRKLRDRENVFFLGDSRLMLILILWKKLLRYDFRICADWHMFFDNRLNRFVVRRVDHSITTSVKLKNFIIDKSGVRPESVSVVYGGTAIAGQADKDKTALREALGLPAEKKLVGYVGLFTTMGMEKGLDTMIKSLPLLDESYVMVLVGARGNEAEKYLKLADELGVRDRCVIVRMKREIEAVYDYQRAMDVLAIPYPDKAHFRDYGFPMKVYDYMAARRPIIYSKLEMAEEVIADYGCSFKPDDPADFARALESIFADYHAAQMKADRAHQAVKEFSWEKKCEKIIKFVSIN